MALPTLEKTWQHNVNQSTTTSGNRLTDLQALLYKIKAALVSFGSTPWTVVRSSDGSANAGAADYWASAANLIWNYDGSNHSWIVLQQSGLNNLQVCIDLNTTNSSPNYLSVFVSHAAGFTGGTLTRRASATDELPLVGYAGFSTPSQWIALDTAMDTVAHVMQSSVGTNTRVIVCAQSTVRAEWLFELLADSALANPAVALCYGQGEITFTYLYQGFRWTGKKDSTTYTGITATEVYNNMPVVSANSGAISDISSAYPITPLSVHSETVTAKGRAGRLVDMWAGSPSFAIAATYPASPDNKQFIQIGQLIHPWNGSTPVIL